MLYTFVLRTTFLLHSLSDWDLTAFSNCRIAGLLARVPVRSCLSSFRAPARYQRARLIAFKRSLSTSADVASSNDRSNSNDDSSNNKNNDSSSDGSSGKTSGWFKSKKAWVVALTAIGTAAELGSIWVYGYGFGEQGQRFFYPAVGELHEWLRSDQCHLLSPAAKQSLTWQQAMRLTIVCGLQEAKAGQSPLQVSPGQAFFVFFALPYLSHNGTSLCDVTQLLKPFATRHVGSADDLITTVATSYLHLYLIQPRVTLLPENQKKKLT